MPSGKAEPSLEAKDMSSVEAEDVPSLSTEATVCVEHGDRSPVENEDMYSAAQRLTHFETRSPRSWITTGTYLTAMKHKNSDPGGTII